MPSAPFFEVTDCDIKFRSANAAHTYSTSGSRQQRDHTFSAQPPMEVGMGTYRRSQFGVVAPGILARMLRRFRPPKPG